ncbi:hypothetical protein F4775DRAFT_568181 [Biscogniauxia sp. FL1348]|nr:hypothetical protein F4775DRAFT_568181 [Biscogniauxia sp. FL1348]
MLAGYAYFKQSEQRTLVHYSNFWWTAYPLPAFWISAFICEKFWSEIVAKYGSKAFAPPHLFKYGYAKTLNGRQLQDEVSLVDQFESYSVSEFHELSARIRTKFWERNEEWAKHRPWRPDVPKDWYHSPWSWQERRSTIESFRYFHAMKDLDQVRRIAVHFVKQEQAFYHGALAQVPAHTIYYLLAVLMFAAIPITSSEFDPGPGIPKIRPFSLTPPPPDAKPLAVYFASSAALAANDIRAFKWPYPDTREKEPLESSDLWWSHQEALETFRQVLMLLEWQYGGSKSWLTGLIDTYSSIKAEREAKPLVTEWTSFPFLVPTFAQDWIRLPEMTDIAIPPNERYRYCDCTWAHMVPIPPYIPQAGTISAQPNLLGGHAASNVHDTTVLRHFTVGEVGNHRGLTDAWVVHPDGMFGHDVYQISDLLHANGANENDYRAMVKTGPFGPELVSGDARADYIRECFKKSLQPIGKVLQKRRPAEVVHFNGSNGAPRWVTAGPYAYDLADFPFSSHEEEQLLDKSAGGPIQMPLSAKNPVAEDLMKRLKPHLCAFIESDRQEAHLYMRQFSPRMLRWHDNPELRCYMAVGGVVYDIGDYTSFHPGGDHIMRKYMGLDATEAFLQAHSLDIMKDFEFMRVGTLVPEIEMDQINNTQVVINGSVYDISKPLTSSVELHETLKLYGGTDASGDMGEHSPGCEALRELLERPDRVVAVISEKLPDIPSGEIVKHSDPHKPEGAWVTVGDWVYNVRDLMLFPQYYEHHISQVWAGAELDDPVLSKWLEENYSARRIGRLVVGSNWPKPVLDTVMVIDTTPKCGFSSN